MSQSEIDRLMSVALRTHAPVRVTLSKDKHDPAEVLHGIVWHAEWSMPYNEAYFEIQTTDLKWKRNLPYRRIVEISLTPTTSLAAIPKPREPLLDKVSAAIARPFVPVYNHS
jgi:hypothetical protein